MAQWQAVGFVHGVGNTDNFSILGETIDYGCAHALIWQPATTADLGCPPGMTQTLCPTINPPGTFMSAGG